MSTKRWKQPSHPSVCVCPCWRWSRGWLRKWTAKIIMWGMHGGPFLSEWMARALIPVLSGFIRREGSDRAYPRHTCRCDSCQVRAGQNTHRPHQSLSKEFTLALEKESLMNLLGTGVTFTGDLLTAVGVCVLLTTGGNRLCIFVS